MGTEGVAAEGALVGVGTLVAVAGSGVLVNVATAVGVDDGTDVGVDVGSMMVTTGLKEVATGVGALLPHAVNPISTARATKLREL